MAEPKTSDRSALIQAPNYRHESSPSQTRPAVTQITQANSGLKTILVVDDEEALRALIAQMLQIHGYQVLEAANGLDALEILESDRHRIDAVVSDIVMPKMNGIQLGQEISLFDNPIPVVYMSGYWQGIPEKDKLVPLGAHVVQKPFQMGELLAKLDELF